MKKILISIFFLTSLLLNCLNIMFIDSINLNEDDLQAEIDLFGRSAVDSLSDNALKIFSGKIKIGNESINDSLQKEIMSLMNADWYIPDGYKFTEGSAEILASNIGEGNAEKCIYESNDLKIGVFSLYSPDYPVRNNIPDSTKFKYNLDDIMKEYILELSAETDYILLCTSIPKKIIKNLVKGLPVDFVYSTDYKKYTEDVLNDQTYFMAVKPDQIGVLSIASDSTGTYEYKEYGREQ